jgi:hypothetical protein
LLKLKSTDEYCYILFSAFNKFAEEPIYVDSIRAYDDGFDDDLLL